MRRKELTDHPFNKDKFSKALAKAIGSRKQKQFCEDSGISYSHVNKYLNGKIDLAPTVTTLKRIAGATDSIALSELLEAAGYDPEKYKDLKPVKLVRKDYFHPVFLGMANSTYDWSIKADGYQDGKPVEFLIEKESIHKWYFVPVTKKHITKDELLNIIIDGERFESGSKVSFVTDDEDIFNVLKTVEFPLLSLSLSAVKVNGQFVEAEEMIKTSLESTLTIAFDDKRRPYEV